MKTSLKAELLLLLAFMLFSVGQCSRRSDNDSKVTICFAFQDLETEFQVAANKAITETLRAKGIKVIERNAHQDANRQLEQISDVIDQDVDGIIMSPKDGVSAVTIIGDVHVRFSEGPRVKFPRPNCP